MQGALLQGFYLGELLVEPLKGQVSGRAGSSHLPPKAAEVLLCLAKNSGEVVERQALINDVWGAGHGSTEALNHAVGEIRHALDDHPSNPKFIQTLPRRGYRLIVTPVPVAAGTDSTLLDATSPDSHLLLFEALKRRGVLETGIAYLVTGWLIIQIADVIFDQLLLPRWTGTFVTLLVICGFPIAVLLSWFLELREGRAYLDTRSVADTPRRRLSRTYLSIVSAMVVASAGVFIYDRLIGLPEDTLQGTAPATLAELDVHENSIAVLPFFNIDGSDTTQVFAHGLAEDVINELARIPGLAVASRGDAWTLEPNSASGDVRRRLRVAYYLEGSVRITDGILRVVVQLINSENGFHLGSWDFDEKVEDFHDLQKQITANTVTQLRVTLPQDIQPAPDLDLTDTNIDAYVLYQQGREVFQEVRSLESIDSAINYFEQALALDPEFAAAQAATCRAYVNRYNRSNDADDISAAQSACNEALSNNSGLYMVHSALGLLHLYTDRDAAAESAFNAALALNPQDVDSMMGLATVYRGRQEYDRAEAQIRLAIATQPGNWRTINNLGTYFFNTGRFDQAAAAFRDVIALDPDNSQALGNLGTASMMAGDLAGAAQVLERARALGDDGRFTGNLATLYYYLGRYDDAVDMYRIAISEAPNDVLPWLSLGDALHFAGRETEARETFRHAADIAERGLAIDPNSWERLVTLAWSRQMLGDSAEAAAVMERAEAVAPDNPYSAYFKALIQLQRGEVGAAIVSIERAIELGFPQFMLEAEPYLEPLRKDGEISDLLTRGQ